MTIKLLLADDHDLVRAGFRAILEKEPDLQVVAEVADGSAVAAAVETHAPDVVLLDLTLPGMNGIDIARELAARFPAVKVIALTMHSRRGYVEAMLKAGALGYLTKRAAVAHLVEAIRTVGTGRRYLEPQAAVALVENRAEAGAAAEEALTALSPRERQVLQWLAEGRNSKQIAGLLGVSVRTADANRQQVMEKLRLGGVAELTRYAIRMGISPLES